MVKKTKAKTLFDVFSLNENPKILEARPGEYRLFECPYCGELSIWGEMYCKKCRYIFNEDFRVMIFRANARSNHSLRLKDVSFYHRNAPAKYNDVLSAVLACLNINDRPHSVPIKDLIQYIKKVKKDENRPDVFRLSDERLLATQKFLQNLLKPKKDEKKDV
ncbi:MAG: hypothetical protein ACTSWX_09310 [Promethearchaeota archaeon]